MQLVEGSDKNGFASYSIKNSIEEVNGSEDVVSFGELGSRIERTYKDTKDSIYTDHFFNLIDTDGDGAISYADLESLKS